MRKKNQLPPQFLATKDAIMAMLVALKIDSANAHWSGGGDEGGVESVTAMRGKDDVSPELKNAVISVERVVTSSRMTDRKDRNGYPVYEDVTAVEKESVSLDQAIEHLAEDLWSHYGEDGWWNNEGGYGDLDFDVTEKKMKYAHYNYTQEEHLSSEADL